MVTNGGRVSFAIGVSRILLAALRPSQTPASVPRVTTAPRDLATQTRQIARDLGIAHVDVYVWRHPRSDAVILGDSDHALLVLTTGIIDLLDHSALAAAITHELAHAQLDHPSRFSRILLVLAILTKIPAIVIPGDRTHKTILTTFTAGLAILVTLAITRTYERRADDLAAAHLDEPSELARALVIIATNDPTARPETHTPPRDRPIRRLLRYSPPLRDRLTPLTPALVDEYESGGN